MSSAIVTTEGLTFLTTEITTDSSETILTFPPNPEDSGFWLIPDILAVYWVTPLQTAKNIRSPMTNNRSFFICISERLVVERIAYS